MEVEGNVFIYTRFDMKLQNQNSCGELSVSLRSKFYGIYTEMCLCIHREKLTAMTVKFFLKYGILFNLHIIHICVDDNKSDLFISGKVTPADVQRVGSRMLKSKLSLVGYGSLKRLPSYDDIQSHLNGKHPKLVRRINPFRLRM